MPIVDASVYVSIAHGADRHHQRCIRWLETRLDDDLSLVAPNLLLVEVAAAIRRLTGDPRLAAAVLADLRETALIELVPLTAERADRAASIAAAAGVRGADAVYLALAQELGDTLVTLDRRQLRRGGPFAPVEHP